MSAYKHKVQYYETQCVCEASSVNAFIDRQGKIIRLKKEYPDLYAKLSELAEN